MLKAAWLSDLTPLDNVNINKGPSNRIISQQYSFATEKDRKSYLNAWGPRPGD